MKIWLKYLIGVALGVAAALVLPVNSAAANSAIEFCSTVSVKIGRYIVVPLVFFGFITAVYKLRDTAQLLRMTALTTLTIVASSLLLTLVGVLSTLFVRLPRIPISVERVTETASLNVGHLIEALFPASGFEALLSGEYLLPTLLLACLIGGACVSDKAKSKPLVLVCDAASNIFFFIMSLIMDVLAIGMIALAGYWAISFFDVLSSGMYTSLIIVLSIDFVLVVGVIYPALIALCFRIEPENRYGAYQVLYASIAPALVAFFSGDTNLTLPFLIRHGKESLGIRRRCSAFAFPLFSAFARGGAALTSAVAFAIILRSYTSLDISALDRLWIVGMSFGLSFLLAGLPVGGPFIVLTVLCTLYGHSVEAGYLLLRPAAIIICAYAAAIDAVTALFGTYFVALKTEMSVHRDRPFI